MLEPKAPKKISDWIDAGLEYCWPLLLAYIILVIVAAIIGISHLILPDSWLAFIFGSNLHQWLPWLEPAAEAISPLTKIFTFTALCTLSAVHVILKRIDETDRKINNLCASIYHGDCLENRIKNLIEYRTEGITELTSIIENMTIRIAKASQEIQERAGNNTPSQ
jgi:hypothetical protein